MKNVYVGLIGFSVFVLFSGTATAGYEGPSPLKDIKVEPTVTQDSGGVYRYNYKVTNPSVNDGEIVSVRIFIPFNPSSEASLPPTGLQQCKRFSKNSSARITAQMSIVPVGSSTPNGWSCGYAQLSGYTDGAFSFGAIDDPYLVKPGSSITGLSLFSLGPPGIRDVMVNPDIDVNRLPPEYNENVPKTVALQNQVKWVGKTIGPKAPPKAFSGNSFIAYLISLVNQSRTQSWIDNDGIENSLLAKLNAAKAKIGAGDNKTAKNIVSAFLNDVQAQNGKHLSAEAYALLYYNGQYLVNHL